MKKILSLLISAVLVASLFAGCSLVTDDDANVVIATVNGKSILKSDYDEVYNYYLYLYMNYYGYSQDQAVSALDSSTEDILQSLVEQEVIRQRAEAEGYFNYTDEQREEAKKQVEEDIQSNVDSMVEQFISAFSGQEIKGKNEGESDEDYFARIARDKYLRQLEQNGSSYDDLINDTLESNALTKFQEDKLSTVVVTDADVQSEYSSMLDTQKQEISTDDLFVSAWNNGSITSATSGSTITTSPVVFCRPGYSLVQHILIKFDDDTANTLQGYYSTLTEYDEEIADYESMIESETDDELKAGYESSLETAKTGREEIQKKYDDALVVATSSIQTKANNIYEAVKSGDEQTFIDAIIASSEDTGMNTEEAAETGYLVGNGDGMVEEFSNAARELAAGEVSAPIATYYGYHIIRCIKTLPDGAIPYADVEEEIRESLVDTKKDDEWSTLTETWSAEAKIKTYKDRI